MRRLSIVWLFPIVFSCCRKDPFDLKWTLIETGSNSFLYSILPNATGDTVFFFGGLTYDRAEVIQVVHNGILVARDSTGPKAIYGSCLVHGNQIRACGYDGIIYTLINGGRAWHLLQTPEWIPLQDIHYRHGWCVAVGGIGGRKGIIQTNHDTTWRWLSLPFDRELKAVAIIDSFTAFAVGQGIVIKTTDKGLSWNPLEIDGDLFTDIQFIGDKTGYILGYNGLLYKTTDGGKSWQKRYISRGRVVNRAYYNDLYFTTPSLGFVCGNDGLILKTEDGGENWQQARNYISSDLYAIWYDNSSETGFACGSHGIIIRFTY